MQPISTRLVYEAHVRGLTREHPAVPAHQRGSFAALGHPAVVDHLTSLGVTTLQLMPVLSHSTDPWLLDLGLTNHWGYRPDDAFALHRPYASTEQPEIELATAVERLHAGGVEVVLDVALALTTGSGHPVAADLVVDVLRHWHDRLGIDGYRFDVAGALDRIAADEVFGSLYLVVEPWDATPEGHRLGQHAGFAEWNDQFRDDVRDFWRGRGTVRDLASHLGGSSPLVDPVERSINFITSHDGFTLRDLVSYDRKHNEANGRDGTDGSDDNRSDNLGVEGDTTDPDIVERRQNRARAMLTTLLLSRGTPMLRMGDELGHTQFGNNHAHAHDSPLTWLGWEAEPGWDLRQHVRDVVSLRRSWIDPSVRAGLPVQWLGPDGRAMTATTWADDDVRRVGMRMGDRTLWCDAGTQTAEVVLELPGPPLLPVDARPPMTRVPVLDVRPQVEHGRFSAKAAVDEQFEVRARVFGEGTKVVGATVVVSGPDAEVRSRVPMQPGEDDVWTAMIAGTEVGAWTFAIESWQEPVATWQRDARSTIAAGGDVEGTLAEGSALLDRVRLSDASITDRLLPAEERLDHAAALLQDEQIRDHLGTTGPHPFFVDRERALLGAWYEMVPRPEGATAAVRLEGVAAMGFDVVLLTPTVDPELGAIDDFEALVDRARQLGLEVALDLALQRPHEIRRIIEHWVEHGVRIFRMGQPHTTPLPFWEQLLAELRVHHPDVIVLSAPVPSSSMLHTLAMLGFHQSHTSFSQCEQPAEIAAFLAQMSSDSSSFMRPHLWVTTHDAVPPYLQSRDPAVFMMRAGLAATASPLWGVLAGHELLELSDPASIAPYLTRLNQIRRAHPSLQRLRNLQPVSTGHHRVVAFTKIRGDDVVLVVVDVRPWSEDTVHIDLDLDALGLPADTAWRDELSGTDCSLAAIPIGPDHPVHILVPTSS